MRRATLTAGLLIGLALRPADADAADPHAKKAAAAPHAPAKPTAKAGDSHATPAPPSAKHAAKAADAPHFTAKTTATAQAPKPADGHTATAGEAHAARAPAAHAAKSKGHPAKAAATHAKSADPQSAEANAHAPVAASHGPDAPTGKAGAGSKPVATDLQALSERIQERMAEVLKAQESAATGAKPRAHRSASSPATAAAPPRVRVDWKIAVSWPEEVERPDETANDADRVSVSWGGLAP